MKSRTILAFWIFIFIYSSASADGLRKSKNTAYKKGEFLKYRVFYDSWLTSGITAGIGKIEVTDDNRKFHGRNTYHIEVEGKSVGLFNLFFKVRDRFVSYIDMETLAPWYFERYTREGSYRKEDKVEYNQFENTAKSSKMKREVPPYVQDIVSAFYYMRTLNFDTLQESDEITVQFHLDDSVYSSKVIFRGIDTVETKLGEFRCLSFQPKLLKGEMFDEDYPMTLWVTDDRNRVPILIQSEVIIGSVKIELIRFNNLANPMTSKLD